MTPRQAFAWARAALTKAGIEDAALDSKLFVLAAWDSRESSVHLLPDVQGNDLQMSRLHRDVLRRAAHEPTAYILGRREFWSLNFKVTSDVLIPRPDSETLVSHALDLSPSRDHPYAVLDLGTGSGCLLLSYLSERPNATGLGIDASAAALAVARENAAELGLSGRARFAIGDWGDGVDARFDLILCNPPYIGERELGDLAVEVRDHEPHGALFAGRDGLSAYVRIVPQVRGLLRPGGVAVIESGKGQAGAIAGLCAAQGLEVIGIRDDLGGIARSIAVRV
jgi:release factor glutamine methyltransferase